jgi:hypothetical protein
MANNEWVPGPPPVVKPPIVGIPNANEWVDSAPCADPSAPSFAPSLVITGVPATIVAPYAWGITLNDGASPPNFSIDHYDSSGAYINSPLEMSGVNGSTTFNDAVQIPAAPLIIPNAGNQLILGGGQPGQVLTALNSTLGQVAWADVPSAEVLEAPTDGQQYGRQNAAWTPVPGFPEAPTDGQIYGRQVANWTSIGGQFLQLIGGTLTGPLYLGGTPASRFVAGGPPGAGLRWAVSYGDNTAESGANAGSNFTIQSFTDAGAPLATPFAINRQLSTITMTGSPGSPFVNLNGPAGSFRSIAGQTNGTNRWQMYLGDFGGELGANAGSNFRLSSYTDAGGALASPLIINRASGQATFSALPSFPGGSLNYVLTTNGAGALAWFPPGIGEAPQDGQQYGRQSAAWTAIAGSTPSSTLPLMDGTAAIGTGLTYARADHIHPNNTSMASTTLPLMSGVAAIGTATTYARADHVHPVIYLNDNRVINGNFAVNQRTYVTNTALVATAYGHDRWKAGAAGCTYTFTAGLPDTTATITAGTLTQVIEAGMIEGGVYTLSWAGTAQARVYQGAPTGAYAASPLTTASLPAGVNTIVEFSTGTLTSVKLEIGSVATPFNRQSLAKSMADCQRYYVANRWLLMVGYVSVAGAFYQTKTNFPVVMRTTPTLVITSNNNSNMQSFVVVATPVVLYNTGANTAIGNTTISCYVSADAEL